MNKNHIQLLVFFVGFIAGSATVGPILKLTGLTISPQPTSFSSAFPQGFKCETALPPSSQIAPTSTIAATLAYIPVASSSTKPLSQDASLTALYVQVQTLNAYLPLLKAVRSGNFSISGNNISIPLGYGSSTDLMSVLNLLQQEIQK